MQTTLQGKTYKTGKYVCFAISEPKTREVWAADFRDRILHHLLVNHLEPIWEKKFIFHSYACRKEKGAHKAIAKINKLLANQDTGLFYLQVDIESFFMNINKDILCNLVSKHVKNPEILWLTKLIVSQDPTDNHEIRGDQKLLASIPNHKSLFHNPKNKGLPIGNYTSQFFANVYLNEIDQFIKHKLKCRFYFRYMDDLLLLHSNKNQLKIWQKEISDFLERNLQLRFHPEKQIIRPVCQGINFLGYVAKPSHMLCRQRIVANLKKKLHRFNKTLNPSVDPKPERKNSFQTALFRIPNHSAKKLNVAEIAQEAQACINSYYGHFKHADCKKLRKYLYFNHFKELKHYLDPVDGDFSYFIIPPQAKSREKASNLALRD